MATLLETIRAEIRSYELMPWMTPHLSRIQHKLVELEQLLSLAGPPICPKCKHLIESGVAHECPSAEYLMARNALIKGAAEAEELFTERELSQYAWDNQQQEDEVT